MPLPAPPTLIIVLMLAGCGANGDATSKLQQIYPASAYSDAPIKVSLLGSSFHPPVRVDTYSGAADVAPAPFQISLDPLRPIAGRRSVAAINPIWKAETQIDTTLPAGLLAGSYTVSLHDAGGNTISSSATYTSLGPDIDPPHIVFLQPPADTTFAPGDTSHCRRPSRRRRRPGAKRAVVEPARRRCLPRRRCRIRRIRWPSAGSTRWACAASRSTPTPGPTWSMASTSASTPRTR